MLTDAHGRGVAASLEILGADERPYRLQSDETGVCSGAELPAPPLRYGREGEWRAIGHERSAAGEVTIRLERLPH
jgi:hypothetical protein